MQTSNQKEHIMKTTTIKAIIEFRTKYGLPRKGEIIQCRMQYYKVKKIIKRLLTSPWIIDAFIEPVSEPKTDQIVRKVWVIHEIPKGYVYGVKRKIRTTKRYGKK